MTNDPAVSLGDGKYLSLTTFRRDGTPVATPVWVMRIDRQLYVITSANSGKVKRLRNNTDVLIAACDVRGQVSGPEFPGVAALLDDNETQMVEGLLLRKYGWQARVMNAGQAIQDLSRRALRKPSGPGRQGISITVTTGGRT